MSRTFLQLCQIAVADLGISGGTLSSTSSGVNQEQQRICNWVARADQMIQSLWSDWTFLWVGAVPLTAQAGATSLPFVTPAGFAGIRSFDELSLWYAPQTSNAQRVTWCDWARLKNMIATQPRASAVCPTLFSVDPTNTIQLLESLQSAANFVVDCWCVGAPLSGDTSRSPVPSAGGLDQIIVERAKIMYAERENAPEILTGSSAEYNDLLDKLQAYYLPAGRAGRTSRNDHVTTPRAYVE